MTSYIVYGEQTIRGYWIIEADSPEEAQKTIEKSGPEFEQVTECPDWEVKRVEENV